MKGKNELVLNETTLCAIVQEWVDREMPRDQKVTGIRSSLKGVSTEPSFVVTLENPPMPNGSQAAGLEERST